MIKKTLWTLNIENYAPEIVSLTYPLLLAYAKKIGADFRIINERRFPDMPITYEKLQIFELGKENDWNVYVDSDAVVSPDMFDITERIGKDTVAHFGHDHASNRWRYDKFFRRDGRDIGSCNWFTAASDWCLDLWHPLDDLSLNEARGNIQPIVKERAAGITRDHLIDDYVLSRNIAKYGLKLKTVQQIQRETNDAGTYAWHTHTLSLDKKIAEIQGGLAVMQIDQMEESRWHRDFTLREWIERYAVRPSSLGRYHPLEGKNANRAVR